MQAGSSGMKNPSIYDARAGGARSGGKATNPCRRSRVRSSLSRTAFVRNVIARQNEEFTLQGHRREDTTGGGARVLSAERPWLRPRRTILAAQSHWSRVAETWFGVGGSPSCATCLIAPLGPPPQPRRSNEPVA